MAITVGIFGISGDGKTTSICINPDGKYDEKNYNGMNPETTVIINADRKKLPFKSINWVEGTNLFQNSKVEDIIGKGVEAKEAKDFGILQKISAGNKVKSVIIDTINGIMVDREMLESKKLTFDKWADLARDIYEIITVCNTLREDLIVYLFGHVCLFTDVDGNESKCLVTNGKKLEKIKLESKLPIVLFTTVDKGTNGDNKHYFETKKNRSTAKTPIGLFEEFLIPNSLKLVDNTIRKYYVIK
jgi:hypothetical protein